MKIRFIGLLVHAREGLAEELELILPFPSVEMVLVTVFIPAADIVDGEFDALGGHGLDDFLVGFFVIEEMVDEAALFFGQAANFAFGPGATLLRLAGRRGGAEIWVGGGCGIWFGE